MIITSCLIIDRTKLTNIPSSSKHWGLVFIYSLGTWTILTDLAVHISMFDHDDDHSAIRMPIWSHIGKCNRIAHLPDDTDIYIEHTTIHA